MDESQITPVCGDPVQSSKPRSLCPICSELDFHKIFREGVSYKVAHDLFVEDGFINRDPIPFDSLTNVLSRSSVCAFCSLVSTAIRRAWFLDTTCADIDISSIDLSLNTDGVRLIREDETGLERALRISILPSALPFEVERANEGPQTNLALHIQLMEEHAEQFKRLRDWHGRVVGDQLDIERVRGWLHSCEQGHGTQCGPAVWAINEELPKGMRVLDIQDMMLVAALPGCRYLALSYVWGNATQCDHRSYCTLSTNLSQRLKPGGIPLAILPATISDTILLTRALKERYLWVDALCICQDDPVHKISQIVAMDRIYMRATLTIYAAGGSSVHAPLPGLRPGTRVSQQQIEEVQGLHLAVPLPASREALMSTAWVGRGWTYQELVLSTRRLILTPSQAIFECSTDVRVEDVVDATDASRQEFNVLLSQAAGPITAWSVMSSLKEFPMQWATEYMTAVELYSSRGLTWPGDVEDAFRGMLNALAKSHRIAGGDANRAFRYAMLVSNLELALLWQPELDKQLVRREVSEGQSRTPWPTWAWTGWCGEVRYTGEELFLSIHGSLTKLPTPGSLVDAWFLAQNDGELERLEVHHEWVQPEAEEEGTYAVPQWDPDWKPPHNVLLELGTLVFRTTRATLRVRRLTSNAGEDLSGKHWAIFAVVLSEMGDGDVDYEVGRVILPHLHPSSIEVEFVALARRRGRPRGDWLRAVGSKESFKSSFLLDVMALKHSDQQGVQERLGVGLVYACAWREANPREEVVLLK